MQFLTITPENRMYYETQLREFYLARYRVFVQKMGWDLQCDHPYEIDKFDTRDASYILITGYKGEIIGGMRLIPTTSTYMAEEIFKKNVWEVDHLPHDPTIYECSRFFIDSDALDDYIDAEVSKDKTKFLELKKHMVYRMFQALIEFGLTFGLKSFIVVTEIRIEKLLRFAGWKVKRLGEPFDVGYTQAFVAEMEVHHLLLENIRKKSHWYAPLLWTQLKAVNY